MGNPHRGDLDVEIGGDEYTLCYDLNACASMMEALHLKTMEDLTDEKTMKNISMEGLIGVLWAGFQRHHPDMTREDVGALDWDIEEIGGILTKAINLGLTRQGGVQGKRKRTSGAGRQPKELLTKQG